MKKKLLSVLCLIAAVGAAQAQSFRKGSLLFSISEGSTWANYTTRHSGENNQQVSYSENISGDRDPLIIEYGLSSHWGIGITSGADIFKIDPSKFYGMDIAGGQAKLTTSEVTIDASYHVFSGPKLDLCVFGSVGGFGTSMKGSSSDVKYSYQATGNIFRTGTKVRYYFYRRFGAFGMLSTFSSTASSKNVTTNTFGAGYSTTLHGGTVEIGLCYRFIR